MILATWISSRSHLIIILFCVLLVVAIGKMSGVISERDYITKIALLGRTSKDTKVKEISTRSAKLVTAKLDEPVESCMEKMLNRVSIMYRRRLLCWFPYYGIGSDEIEFFCYRIFAIFRLLTIKVMLLA